MYYLIKTTVIVDLLRQVVDVIIMMAVRKQFVKVFVAYECVFVYRHSLKFSTKIDKQNEFFVRGQKN